MNPSVFTLKQGHVPLLISIPHCGEILPPGLAARFSPQAKRIPDTDWHLPRLYHDLAERLGASVLQANYSRYVIDLNRSSDDSSSLYPGQKTTTLCPTITFLDESIYTQEDDEPNEVEIASRIEQYWKPYHDALDKEIQRLLEMHDQVLVWEAHSIKSELPMLFDGVLTTLNLANNDGIASSPEILDAAVNVAKHSGLTWSENGRFKGGFITRNYASPEKGIHFIQLEMGRCAYMDEDEPWGWHDEPATRTANMLYEMVSEALSALTDQTTDKQIDIEMIRNIARSQHRFGIKEVEVEERGERLKIEVGKSDIRTSSDKTAHTLTLRAKELGILEMIDDPIKKGDHIAPGQILANIVYEDRCVEVLAPFRGQIGDVLVKHGDRIDYGMALFILQPEEM